MPLDCGYKQLGGMAMSCIVLPNKGTELYKYRFRPPIINDP